MASCFFCGSEDVTSSSQNQMHPPNGQTSAFHSWMISCVSSVSAALGLSLTPTLEQTMTRQAKYCEPCLGLMRDIDFFSRSLHRIQSGLSSKTAILRRQIRLNCERQAYSSQNPVPGSREFVLRTLIESKLSEGVRNKGNCSSDIIEEQEQTSLLETRVLDSHETRKLGPVQKRLPSILRRGIPKKKHCITRNTRSEQSDESKGDEDYVPLTSVSDDHEALIGEVEDKNNDETRNSENPVRTRTNKCQYCGKEFRSRIGLRVHERRHSKRAFRCGTCSRVLTTQKRLQSHERICSRYPNLERETCPRPDCHYSCRKGKEVQLAVHIRKVHEGDPKPFHCPNCPLQFKRNENYSAHLRWHNPLRLVTCHHCSATFSQQAKLDLHNRACTAERPRPPKSKWRSAREDPPTQCTHENCEYMGNSTELLGHERTVHLGQASPFVCSVCEKGFQTALALNAHERLHMLRTGEAQYKCEYCPKEFWNRHALNKHGRARHYLEVVLNLKFSCDACTKHFGTEDELHAHAGLHEVQELPFACVLCESVVPDNSIDLKSHVKHSHEDGLPQCPLCLKRFKSVGQHAQICQKERAPPDLRCPACPYVGLNHKWLNKHRLQEHGGGNFMCQDCGKIFLSKSTMNEHMRKHSGELPYACALCPRRFPSSWRLKNHEQTHATQDSHFCPKCSKGFKTHSYMWQHVTMYCQLNPDRRPSARSRNKQAEETFPTATA